MSKKVIFYGFLFLCAIGGACSYFIVDALAQNVSVDILLILSILGYVSLTIGTMFTVISFIYYFKCKRIIKQGMDDEDSYSACNKAACITTNLTSATLPLLFYSAATSSVLGFGLLANTLIGGILLIVDLALMVTNVIMQIKILKLAKVLHPEITASEYDLKFQSKWNNQMDEALKDINEKAAFKSLQLMFKIYPMIALVFLVLAMVDEFSVLPLLIVCVLWFVHLCTYGYNAYLIENYPSKVKGI